MNLHGKSVPERVRKEAADAAANEERAHQISLAAYTAKQNARAMKGSAGFRLTQSFIVGSGKLGGGALSLVGNIFKSASIVIVAGGVTAATFGTITGIEDHKSKPNPNNENTGVRVLQFGTQNVKAVARDLDLDGAAMSLLGAANGLFNRVSPLESSGQASDQKSDDIWNQDNQTPMPQPQSIPDDVTNG